MNNYITGKIIRELRTAKGLTQSELAEILSISDKTVSKWETGRGLPDITLLESLSKALGVSIAELFSGEQIFNGNKSGNMKKGVFYVCPLCGNVIFSVGESNVSCCGINLPKQEAEEIENHTVNVETIDTEYYITVDHEMSKSHYISFIAYVTGERCNIVKLYPEQNAEAYFEMKGHGMIYAYCNKDGMFKKSV